jgi:flagellar biosynthesis protein
MKKAVVLKYPEGCLAPIITAKGTGIVAQKIIEEAEKQNVFITENLELVNLLDSCDTGTLIPEETWEAVAIIFSFILGEKGEENEQ